MEMELEPLTQIRKLELLLLLTTIPLSLGLILILLADLVDLEPITITTLETKNYETETHTSSTLIEFLSSSSALTGIENS